jgi:hypothetical protein
MVRVNYWKVIHEIYAGSVVRTYLGHIDSRREYGQETDRGNIKTTIFVKIGE